VISSDVEVTDEWEINTGIDLKQWVMVTLIELKWHRVGSSG
jgi:hypothetical protein